MKIRITPLHHLTKKAKTALLKIGKETIYKIVLKPEPQNKFDSNAIKVMLYLNNRRYKIGYISKNTFKYGVAEPIETMNNNFTLKRVLLIEDFKYEEVDEWNRFIIPIE